LPKARERHIPFTETDYSYDRYSARRLYYALDFLPGSQDIIYSANTSGQFNLWRQAPPRNSVLGPAKQLTGFDEWSVRFIAPHPSGRQVLVFADKDGNENYQIFTVDAEEGWQTPVVMKPTVRNTFGSECLSPDGALAAYTSNERKPQDLDVVVTKVPGGKTRRLLADGGLYLFGCWSPDGRYATVVETLSWDDLSIDLLNMKTGRKTNLTPHKEKAIYFPGPWSPDGEGFFVLSNGGREFFGLGYLRAREGAQIKWLETPEKDVEDVTLSPDGQTIAMVVNEGGYASIHFRDYGTGRMLGSVKLDGFVTPGWFENTKWLKFSADGNRLAFILAKPTRPVEVCVLRVPGQKVERVTDGFIGGIPENTMVRPKSVVYQSFDRKVPAFLYEPKATRRKRSPVVVSIHGGPVAQERPAYAYAGLYQYVLRRGIGVLAPNIRGSTGYGKKYERLVYRDWGGGELKDIEYAAKYLETLAWVDPERMGVFGASFGGFATLSAVTRLPKYWRVAVDIFGPSNLVTFARTVPEHWKRNVAGMVGDPDKESDFLLSRSPVTFIENVRCPLLIIQGANDPRVTKPESDQIVEKLKSKGLEMEYMVFPDEGHGFTKRRNEFTAYKRVAEFLVEHLQDGRGKEGKGK
jgi:dipeptidyl aminopeptidase/acylaminoacyl peptidase